MSRRCGTWAAELVERARSEGVELTGDNGLLTALVRQVLQTGLEVEMTDHLGYEPHAAVGRGSGNNRNGHYPKPVKTEIGEVDLRVPRDRNSSFTGRINAWKPILNALTIHYGDRIRAAN
jgi:putative transposase